MNQVKQMNVLAECDVLGELSDYCFRIHDLSMSKLLFKDIRDSWIAIMTRMIMNIS